MPRNNLLIRIVKSYGRDVIKWLNGVGARYAIGIGLAAGGALSLLVATVIGTAAAFYFIETGYGPYTAYAIIGGAYGVLGIAGLISGRALLGKPAISVPSPHRQIQMLKRAISVPAATLLLASDRREPSRPDLLTQVLAAGAAVTLLGWIVVTHLQRRQGTDRR